MEPSDWQVATGVLRLSAQLVDGIQDGMARRGFVDVRPAHGFAFARLSSGPATTAALAQHLGVTKQAASQLVDQLVERGYVERRPDPDDARQKLLVLTERGRVCTRAAESAAAETVRQWREAVAPDDFASLQAVLAAVVRPGAMRPSW